MHKVKWLKILSWKKKANVHIAKTQCTHALWVLAFYTNETLDFTYCLVKKETSERKTRFLNFFALFGLHKNGQENEKKQWTPHIFYLNLEGK